MDLDQEIAAVREAIASGALEVRIRQNSGVEKYVKYESFDALLRRLKWLEAQKNEALGIRRVNVGFAEFKR